jgi:flagellar biosynthetic protein FliR
MLDPNTIAVAQFWKFLIVLCRVSGLFLAAPVFGFQTVPGRVKIGLAAMVSVITLTVNLGAVPPPPDSVFPLAVMVFKETAVGLLLGFGASVVFFAIQAAGRFVDMQMGFAVVSILDPATQIQTSVLGQFQYVVAMLIFLALNGHQWLIRAVVASFHWVPMGGATMGQALFAHGNNMIAGFFLIAVQVAAPVAAALLVVDIGFAVLSRAMPQLNIFIVGFPVKILLGLFTVAMGLVVLLQVAIVLIGRMQHDLVLLIRSLGG